VSVDQVIKSGKRKSAMRGTHVLVISNRLSHVLDIVIGPSDFKSLGCRTAMQPAHELNH